eukprot:3096786-Rhodomonas_salina.4
MGLSVTDRVCRDIVRRRLKCSLCLHDASPSFCTFTRCQAWILYCKQQWVFPYAVTQKTLALWLNWLRQWLAKTLFCRLCCARTSRAGVPGGYKKKGCAPGCNGRVPRLVLAGIITVCALEDSGRYQNVNV